MPDAELTPPNLVVILSDQQRWDTLGCYGQPSPISPNLDELAKRGTRYEHAFTCQPLCNPARASLQSGRYASEIRCSNNGSPLPQNIPTVAGSLAAAGYQAAYVGKWHLASTAEGEYHHAGIPQEHRGGYESFWAAADLPEFCSHGHAGRVWDETNQPLDFAEYRADAYTNHAIRFLRNRDRSKPFLLWLSFVEPHPQPVHERYAGPPLPKHPPAIRGYLRYEPPADAWESLPDAPLPDDLARDAGDWEAGWRPYLACCENVDQQVGRVIDALEQEGIREQTVVVFTSDHGNHFHTRNASDGKQIWHDNATRIPLIVAGPGFDAGHVVEAPVSLVDVPATLLHTADVAPPDAWPGRNLAEDLPNDRAVLIEVTGPQNALAIATSRWKFAVDWPQQAPDTYGHDLALYDRQADPSEQHNLVDTPQHAQTRIHLRDRLIHLAARRKAIA